MQLELAPITYWRKLLVALSNRMELRRSKSAKLHQQERGSISTMVVAACMLVFFMGIGLIDLVSYIDADSRAGIAAEAAAHAAASLLATANVNPDLNQALALKNMSLDLQSGKTTCRSVNYAPISSSDLGCVLTFTDAADKATKNGAKLASFYLAPDTRDIRVGIGAGRFATLVKVAVRRNFPIGPDCSKEDKPSGDKDYCWSQAWGAAQEVQANT